MTEVRGNSRGWSLYLAGSGLLAVLLELSLGIVSLEQVLSPSQFSFHHVTTLVCLLASLIVAPVPWVVIRRGCKQLRTAMLSMGADDNSISTLERIMGGILILCYVALISCVIALARLS